LKLREDNIFGLDLNKVGRFKVGGKTCTELPIKLKKAFDKFILTIAAIEDATGDEVRTLFGRLQLGESLKPSERRNAILCIVHKNMSQESLL